MNPTEAEQNSLVPSPRAEFFRSVRTMLPILLGVVPFGLIYGALARQAHLSIAASQGMSSIVFAGSAQFVATELFRNAMPAAVIVATLFVINLRHALYSASIAPYTLHLSAKWKALLAYLLTDEAYAVAIVNYQKLGGGGNQHWFFFGAGMALWFFWQLSTLVGITLGAVIPASWQLDFTLPLVFIALLIPLMRGKPEFAAAIVAGSSGILFLWLPFRLNIPLAAVLGILAGVWVKRRT